MRLNVTCSILVSSNSETLLTTTTMTKQAEIELAKTYASIAYAKGIKIAAYDKDLMSMLDGKKAGEGLHILRAYSAEITRLHAADFNASVAKIINS